MWDYIFLFVYACTAVISVANVIIAETILGKFFWILWGGIMLIMSNLYTFMILFKALGL